MALNFPGPYEIRLFYTVTPSGLIPIQHVARYNCDLTAEASPGDDLDVVTLVTKGGVATPTVNVAMAAWNTLISGNFNLSTTFDRVELWKYAAGTFDATFINASTPVESGVNAGATVPAGQDILTWRTQEGGLMRIAFMEGVSTPGAALPLGNSGIPRIDNVSDFVVSDANWILARDTSYPVAPIRWNPGQNEAVFKRRYR